MSSQNGQAKRDSPLTQVEPELLVSILFPPSNRTRYTSFDVLQLMRTGSQTGRYHHSGYVPAKHNRQLRPSTQELQRYTLQVYTSYGSPQTLKGVR